MTEPPPPPSAARRAPPPIPTAANEARAGAVDELIELGADEVAHGSDPARNDELRVRLALLTWDGRHDARAAAAWLDKVEHPAAAALRRELAIAGDDLAQLAKIADEALARGDGKRDERAQAELAELGEQLLWRGGDVERAIALLRASGAAGKNGLSLALAVAGQWAALRESCEKSEEAADWIEAAAIAGDRLGDEAAARALCRRAWDARGKQAKPAEQAYL